MRQVSFLTLILVLTLGLGGCGAASRFLPGGGDQASVDEIPQEPMSVPEAQDLAPAQQFGEPVVEDESPPVGNVPPDLIASTDPNQRASEVQRDRADPFSFLPTAPTVEIPPEVRQQQQQQQQQQRQPAAAQPGAQPTTTPGGLAPIPDLVPRSEPAPPQPNLARAVEVTGIVQIGNVPYAIVSAPNEPHTRYVRAGQRLSNGRVLIKQINVFSGAEPTLVLEENGIEVVREVDGVMPTETAAAMTVQR
jgi:hypothetical protein